MSTVQDYMTLGFALISHDNEVMTSLAIFELKRDHKQQKSR